jgi:hypothetical protein
VSNSNPLGYVCPRQTLLCFFYSDGKSTIFGLVYVDDIIVASSAPKFTNTLVKKLNQEFALKDLGDPHYFLGIEVKRTKNVRAADVSRKICPGHPEPCQYGNVQSCKCSYVSK